MRFVDEQLGEDRGTRVRNYSDQISRAGPEYRLPLLEIAFPALKMRPAPQLEFLLELVQRVIELDGEVDLYEYCFYRVLTSSLQKASKPAAGRKGNRASKKAIRLAAIDLVSAVAQHGHASADEASSAYRAGIDKFGAWAASTEYEAQSLRTAKLDRSLDVLGRMNSAGRKSLLQALATTVSHDGKLTATEANLLRAVCASLDCPLPPIIG